MESRTGSTGYVVLVSCVAALGGLLFGYDTAVINGAIGFLEEHFELNPVQKGWAGGCALVGCCIGVALAGFMSDLFGRRRTLILAAVLFFVSAVGTALPRTFTVFILFRILGGIGVGAASMTSPMYIAEISPARLRGRMVSLNQLTIVSGILMVYFVNYFIAHFGAVPSMGDWNVTTGWRWMFGSEALPALLLFVLLFMVPESPRWMAKRGKEELARQVLIRAHGEEEARVEMGEIRDSLGRSFNPADFFGKGMMKVLFIGVALAVLQQITGINVIMYYGAEVFKSVAGAETDHALLMQIVVGVVMLVFTVVAIGTVDRIGRRKLMIAGAAGMGVSLLAIGLVAWTTGAIGQWLLLFILGYIACFSFSVGPVTWVILSEIFPTRVRGCALFVATFFLWAANYVVSQTFPMMNENAYLISVFHRGFPFMVYAFFCIVLVFFMILFVPETKGKTLEEIETWVKGGKA